MERSHDEWAPQSVLEWEQKAPSSACPNPSSGSWSSWHELWIQDIMFVIYLLILHDWLVDSFCNRNLLDIVLIMGWG